MQNLTTWVFSSDEEAASENASDDADKDIVVTTASDASSGDGKVAARSVDGDDDVVDVTMKDSTAPSSHEASHAAKRQLPGQTEPPKWLDPAVPLSEAYDNVFDITYWHSGREIIPFGHNTIDDDTSYHSISSRVRRRATPVEELVHEPVTERETTPVSEEDEDVAQLGDSVTRMNEESSDEDDDLAAPKVRQ